MAEKLLEACSDNVHAAARDMAAPPIVYRGDLKSIPRGGSSSGGGGGGGSGGGSGEASADERMHKLRDDILVSRIGGGTAVVGGHGTSTGGLDGHVWVAASTHAGEEEAVLEAHAALRRSSHPDLLLLLVPRHVERGPRLKRAVEEAYAQSPAAAQAMSAVCCAPLPGGTAGWHVALRSAGEAVRSETAVYVCDTLGELPLLYSLAGVAFVGGSLVPLGGHSLLEAAQADGGCVVLHGPHIEAVQHAAASLGDAVPPAAQLVRDAETLQQALRKLLSDGDARRAGRDAAARTARTLEAGVLQGVWEELRVPLGLNPERASE